MVQRETDLVDYISIVWRRRMMIVGLCFFAMAATVAYMLMQPRRYESTATILPPVQILKQESTLPGRMGGLGSAMLRDIMDTGSLASLYVEILKSREVMDAIIDEFDLMRVYEKEGNRTKTRRELSKNTKIEATDEGAVKIAVVDLDPNRAAGITGAYVRQLDKQNKRLSTGEATSKRVFLEGRLQEVEAKLGQIENLPAHEVQVQEMLYEMLVRECELAKIEEAKSMPTLQVLDEPIIPELPVARGTVQKGILAGIAAFMFGVFLAFTREYAAAFKGRGYQLPPSQGLCDVAPTGKRPESAEVDIKVTAVSMKRNRHDEYDSDSVERSSSV